MIILVDVFWVRVNSCRTDRSVSFRVGGDAVVLIIVGAGPTSWGWFAVPLGLRINDDVAGTSQEEEPWA